MKKERACQSPACRVKYRLLTIRARAKDMHSYTINGMDSDGNYAAVLCTDGDTTEFTVCLECGQVQGEFPEPPMFMEPDYSDPEGMS